LAEKKPNRAGLALEISAIFSFKQTLEDVFRAPWFPITASVTVVEKLALPFGLTAGDLLA
jgi:hypothetical protein